MTAGPPVSSIRDSDEYEMSVGEVVGAILAVTIGIGVWVALGYGVWRTARVRPNPSTMGTQIRATRAILKFCQDHPSEGIPVDRIRDCLLALEEGNARSAVDSFQRIHLGPHGFGDWFPPVAFEHENGEYVWAVFEALFERWHRLMQLLAKGQPIS